MAGLCGANLLRLLTHAFVFLPYLKGTHSQVTLLHSLKRANYHLPLLVTDSGVPQLSNSTEIKVQVCTCKKNKMDCSTAWAPRANLLWLGLALALLSVLCEYTSHNVIGYTSHNTLFEYTSHNPLWSFLLTGPKLTGVSKAHLTEVYQKAALFLLCSGVKRRLALNGFSLRGVMETQGSNQSAAWNLGVESRWRSTYKIRSVHRFSHLVSHMKSNVWVQRAVFIILGGEKGTFSDIFILHSWDAKEDNSNSLFFYGRHFANIWPRW